MNEIVKKVLLAGEKVMSEIQLRQPEFMYIACGTFTKNKKGIKKLKKKPRRFMIYLSKRNR